MKKKLLLCLLGISAISAFAFGCKTSATEEVSNRNTVYLTGEFPDADELDGDYSLSGGAEGVLNKEQSVDYELILKNAKEAEDELTVIAVEEFMNVSDLAVKEVFDDYLRDGVINEQEYDNLHNPEAIAYMTTKTCEINICRYDGIVNDVRKENDLDFLAWNPELANVASRVLEEYVTTGKLDTKGYKYVLCRTDKAYDIGTWKYAFMNCNGFEEAVVGADLTRFGICSANIEKGGRPYASYGLILLSNEEFSQEEFDKYVYVVGESENELEVLPTEEPSETPSAIPSEEPTEVPTSTPSAEPTIAPTATPTVAPTEVPLATEPTAESILDTIKDLDLDNSGTELKSKLDNDDKGVTNE